MALARGAHAQAREQFALALEADPESVEARLGLAEVARLGGEPQAARAQLRAVIRRDPQRAEAHARLAALTGPAAAGPPSTAKEAVRRAGAHPYDTLALLVAANALARGGQTQAAIRLYQRIVWLGDVAPPATAEALRRLRELSPEWAERRAVAVHSYADEIVRGREGWRFSVRNAWRAVSASLMPILDVRFVPISISSFRTEGLPPVLDDIHDALRSQLRPAPANGILAGFSGREPPRVAGYPWKQGFAQLLGRWLTVRFGEHEPLVRTLAHEVLHLYGAIHVSDEIESLMNPRGQLMTLDPFNLAIVEATRPRSFGAGGVATHVLARIDLDQTISAYVRAMHANLVLRNLGIDRAIASARESRFAAIGELRRAQNLDPHLGDMASIVAEMMRLEGRRVESLLMLEAAARLYGPQSPRGRAARETADRLRRALQRELL